MKKAPVVLLIAMCICIIIIVYIAILLSFGTVEEIQQYGLAAIILLGVTFVVMFVVLWIAVKYDLKELGIIR